MAVVLITGTHGYVANSLLRYLRDNRADVSAELIDLRSGAWIERSFKGVDAIVHTAALVHKNERKLELSQYRAVNTDLTLRLAEKAKADGVSQFVFFSTEGVYGAKPSCFRPVAIDAGTPLGPSSKYAVSKLEAEQRLSALEADGFTVSILRPPMVYGPGCPGNYGALRRLTLKFTLAPKLEGKKSFIYIDNLCELICALIEQKRGGVFCPQNGEPVSTYEMMRLIGEFNGKRVRCLRVFNPLVRLFSLLLPKLAKAFGSMYYDASLSRIPGVDYCLVPFRDSIRMTELGK